MTPGSRQRHRREGHQRRGHADVAPLTADFTFFGGLYRDVHLLVTDPLHVDALDFGSSGVYCNRPTTSARRPRPWRPASASATIRRDPRRSRSTPCRGRRRCDRLASVGTSNVSAGSRARTLEPSHDDLANPHLWNGVADPYLYTAYVEIRVGGTLVDWLSVPLGFRFFSVDAAQGFSLNGQYLDLHGVNRHQDRLDMGWAIADAQHDEDMALIREIGRQRRPARRTTSTPSTFYDLADRDRHDRVGRDPAGQRHHRHGGVHRQRQPAADRADPPELQPPVDRCSGASATSSAATTRPTNRLLTQLNTLAHAGGSARLSDLRAVLHERHGRRCPQHTDMVGYNTYYGWYDAFGTSEQFAAWADDLHAARPTLEDRASANTAPAAASR